MINYAYISEAIEYYQSQGYEYIEVPWVASEEAMKITLPPFINLLWETPRGHLLGSGEQGFLQMMMDGTLPPGKYVCATPCFRDETPDKTHHNWFFKVELINTEQVNKDSLSMMLTEALHFYRKYIPSAVITEQDASWDPVALSHSSWDIESSEGVELGSYGLRGHEELNWVYGTGCAEPRLSYVISQSKKLAETS